MICYFGSDLLDTPSRRFSLSSKSDSYFWLVFNQYLIYCLPELNKYVYCKRNRQLWIIDWSVYNVTPEFNVYDTIMYYYHENHLTKNDYDMFPLKIFMSNIEI